jgi:hypothetical protein
MKIIIYVLLALCIGNELIAKDEKIKKVILVKLDNIRPTQFTVGVDAIIAKAKRLREIFKEVNGSYKLRTHLQNKAAPAILGPDKKYYIVDHHHLARAIMRAIPSYNQYYVYLEKDYSNLDQDQFYQKMIKNGHVYLYKFGQGPHPITSLPGKLSLLQNDNYRSLALFLRETDAFKKTPVSFSEFSWANYLRDKIKIKRDSKGKISLKTISKAFSICRDKKASHLPGYIGDSKKEKIKKKKLKKKFDIGE